MRICMILTGYFFGCGLLFGQYTAIPDPIFEQALIDLAIDSEGTLDGQILTADATSVGGLLDVSSMGISDLTGIESFTSITELNCSYNNLSSLDLTNQSALWTLNCSWNYGLTTLEVEGLINLFDLNCSYCSLEVLDVRSLIGLSFLECSGNRLYHLDLLNASNLQVLFCSDNFLTYLDLSQNRFLQQIYCYNYEMYYLGLTADYSNLSTLVIEGSSSFCVEVNDVDWFEANFGASNPTVQFSDNCASCNSVNIWKGGFGWWHDPTKWTFGRVPSFCEDVNIQGEGSVVFVDNGVHGEAASIALYEGSRLKIYPTASLTINCDSSKFTRSGIFLRNHSRLENQGVITIEKANQFGISIGSGLVQNSDSISILAYGLKSNRIGGINLSGSSADFSNSGQIGITSIIGKDNSDGIRLEAGSSFTNLGAATIQIADVSGISSEGIDNQGSLLNYGSITIDSVGTGFGIVNRSGATVDTRQPIIILNIGADDAVDNRGSWEGKGTVSDHGFANASSVSPGPGIEKINMQVRYRKEASSLDTIELNGRNGPGNATGHDQIAVVGNLELAGDIFLVLGAGFQPAIEDTFVIMTYTDSLSGVIDTLHSTFSNDWVLDYSGHGEVVLRNISCRHAAYVSLMEIYDDLAGESWTINTGWSEGANGESCDPCIDKWYGVSCQNGEVTGISLPNNNLDGTLPSAIGALPQLAMLDLSSNSLGNVLPESLLNLNLLEILDVSTNNLSGGIDSNLFFLPNLKSLDLSTNGFEILPSFKGSPSMGLRKVALDNNPTLAGSLPPGLGIGSQLDTLWVHNCNLADCYPTSYLHLCTKVVDFSGNMLPAYEQFCLEDGVGACSDCDAAAMTLDENPISNATFVKVSDAIHSGGTIADGGKVLFHAGNSININPGFEVTTGGYFVADIKPCDP